MFQRHGHVQITDASRHLQRLCYHFQRKITVQYDEHQGDAQFPWGRCQLQAHGDALHFHCSAADAEQLAKVQFAIDSHVELFSRKNPVQVLWAEVTTAATATPAAASTPATPAPPAAP